jgi:hypothetical protein
MAPMTPFGSALNRRSLAQFVEREIPKRDLGFARN